ncbi:NAD(P)/FAD-dependent oxidoreductase [Rhodococcus sp. NPDC058514]|uniref:NAD(P)/FAD-dependent oxidoreductase n=1 Tax=unclassified Rhodococcus (in: high G+C Gram-positive bacteria) TaxID=192944 RepID=UPI00365A9BB0
MSELRQVVVVGAGYAGVMAANRILAAGQDGVTVTVVNPRADFVERIRLHQRATDGAEATVPLAELLHPDARLHLATVDRIGDRAVLLDGGQSLPYDYLVYAVGSVADRGGNPADSVHTVGDLEDADRLRARLRELPGGADVTVVGGGLTGIETAAEVAERRPDLAVRLVSAGPLAEHLPAASRASITRTLTSLGIAVREGARIRRVADGRVELDDGSSLPSDCTVWAGAFGVPDLARRSGLPVDESGRLRTDESLICQGHPTIVGVGDAVAPPATVAGHVRMSCQAALPLGAHGADTVLALLRGESPDRLSLGFLAQCVSLGRRSGLFQLVRADDSPRRFALRGRLGAFVKEQICRSTVKYVRAGSYPGPAGPKPVREQPSVSA